MVDCSCSPPAYRWAILQNLEDRGEGISISSVTGCLAKSFLQAKENYSTNLADLHASSFRGSLTHGVMEAFGQSIWSTGHIIERRFHVAIWPDGRITPEAGRVEGAVMLSGKPDSFNPTNGLLEDWKTTGSIVPRFLPQQSHLMQLRGYTLLLRKHGFEVLRNKLHYIDGKSIYPVETTVPPTEEIERVLIPRVKELDHSFQTGIAPTTSPSVLCDGTARGGKVFCDVKFACPFYHRELEGKRYN